MPDTLLALTPSRWQVCEGTNAVAFLDAISAAYYPGVWAKDPRPHFQPGCQESYATALQFTFVKIFAGISGGRCILTLKIDEGAMETYAQHFYSPSAHAATNETSWTRASTSYFASLFS
mmetsp:Transcript_461/g.1076  ORF Transcript_461/g.1076 Transcript_461/m.1076 type:complete len:119 (-) Transcript_461:99-455(-)